MKPAASLPGECEVAIVGAGPAGLSAALALVKAGIDDVHILERDTAPGGIPRHCGHPPFGLREFNRVLTGPAYARRLANAVRDAGVATHTGTTVVGLGPQGRLALSTTEGEHTLLARRVLLATGVRETPRSTRLVSGARPAGITTTGALQSTVYLAGRRPFRRPVIVGTELVSFSALLTCRHAGMRPAAMLEAGSRTTAWRWSTALPLALRVPVLLDTRIDRILGIERVDGVRVVNARGACDTVPCDGVVFTGRFVPEATLLRGSHLELDPASGGPVVDQFGRCSDASYFAAGNLLRPVETAGWCWAEGRRAGRWLAASLRGELPHDVPVVTVRANHSALKFVTPQRIVLGDDVPNMDDCRLQLRVNCPVRDVLTVAAGGRELLRHRIRALPERRVLVDLPRAALAGCRDTLTLDLVGS